MFEFGAKSRDLAISRGITIIISVIIISGIIMSSVVCWPTASGSNCRYSFRNGPRDPIKGDHIRLDLNQSQLLEGKESQATKAEHIDQITLGLLLSLSLSIPLSMPYPSVCLSVCLSGYDDNHDKADQWTLSGSHTHYNSRSAGRLLDLLAPTESLGLGSGSGFSLS